MNIQGQTSGESNKFVLDIIWVAFSQIFMSLLGIVTLPFLTKTYTSEIYGIWTQVNITVGLLVTVITLQFVTTVVRFLAAEEDKVKRRRSIGTMLYTILIFGALILGIGNLWASQISLFLFNNATYAIFVRLAFLWACADALLAFFISYLRARGKIKKLAIIQAILSALKMGLIVVLVLSGLILQWVIAGLVFVDLVFILYVLFIIVREDGFPLPNFSGLKVFLTFSIPQIPGTILGWIMSASDRYFITHFINLPATGIYASSNSLAGLIALFYSPIGYVLFPVVSKTWEQNRKTDTKVYFEYSTRLFLTLAIPATVGLSMISQSLLKILTTSEYLAGIWLVLLIGISQIFMGIFQINEYIIYLVKQTNWLPLIIFISAGISIILNFTLIPYFGITGAAISKIVAYFVLAAIVSMWTKKVISYNFNFIYAGKVTAASLIMAVCLYFLKIDGILGIVISVVTGAIVFVASMLLMKGFTRQDKKLLKETFGGIFPRRKIN
jgi:O-antigen/teichoic acid export membrane protein